MDGTIPTPWRVTTGSSATEAPVARTYRTRTSPLRQRSSSCNLAERRTTMENKAEIYRKMLAFLDDLGADLGPHSTARIASAPEADFDTMDGMDLLHYQRVLEATIDNRSDDLMDKTSMKNELTEVVRERF